MHSLFHFWSNIAIIFQKEIYSFEIITVEINFTSKASMKLAQDSLMQLCQQYFHNCRKSD